MQKLENTRSYIFCLISNRVRYYLKKKKKIPEYTGEDENDRNTNLKIRVSEYESNNFRDYPEWNNQDIPLLLWEDLSYVVEIIECGNVSKYFEENKRINKFNVDYWFTYLKFLYMLVCMGNLYRSKPLSSLYTHVPPTCSVFS